MVRFFTCVLISVATFTVSFAQSDKDQKKPEKLAADVIIAKHLASIGTTEALAAVKSRVMVGVGVHTAKNSAGKIGGATQFATAGDKFVLAMLLNSSDYPYEKFGYDGKDLTTASLPGGGVSALGDFLKSNKVIFKNGLMGGVLSQGWLLYHPGKNLKLESAGIAKVEDKNLYKLRLSGPGLGDMTVSLYFEPETFRHVRTEYSYRIGQLTSPNPDRPSQIGGTAPQNFTLTEEFSNFTKVDDLVLPLTYQLEYTNAAGRSLMWAVNFKQVFNNQEIDAAAFRVS